MTGSSPLPLLALLVGCSSTAAPDDALSRPDLASPAADGPGAAAGDLASALDLASRDDAEAGAVCPPGQPFGGGERSVVGGSVNALIVDEAGAPVPNQPTYICGLDLCSSPGSTGADGRVFLSTQLPMKRPVFKYGDAVNYAQLAIPLLAAKADFTRTGPLATARLSGRPSAELVPGAEATSGEVTLTLDREAIVGIDGLTYDTADRRRLRAVRMPIDRLGPVLDPVVVGGAPAKFELVYGVAPAETTICPPAQVKVALPRAQRAPNDLGWPAGAAVEFWIMTTDVTQTYAPYGGWAKISDGAVSQDGTTVATTGRQGFPMLGNFAIRRVP